MSFQVREFDLDGICFEVGQALLAYVLDYSLDQAGVFLDESSFLGQLVQYSGYIALAAQDSVLEDYGIFQDGVVCLCVSFQLVVQVDLSSKVYYRSVFAYDERVFQYIANVS